MSTSVIIILMMAVVVIVVLAVISKNGARVTQIDRTVRRDEEDRD
jgi:hypothetical protein